jgi:hypothetical protein
MNAYFVEGTVLDPEALETNISQAYFWLNLGLLW